MPGGDVAVAAAGRAALPELARVPWRPLADERALKRAGQIWTLSTVAHALPFVAVAVLLGAIKPLLAPMALLALVHAWAIPELYAARGACVVRTQRRAPAAAERVAMGFLGDLLDHPTRELYARTRLVLERGRFGVWLISEAGALLVRPGGRRVHCYCVKATDAELPSADRAAHLLLALRTDERGFATVANLAFSGACWRLRRRLPARGREALARAVTAAR